MSRRPSGGKLLEPLARDGLKTAARALYQRRLGRLALSAGVNAVRDQLARRVAFFARLLEPDIGISSKRE